MYHKLFPTLIAEYNLNDKVDNEEIINKMRMSGLQFHGILQKGQSMIFEKPRIGVMLLKA